MPAADVDEKGNEMEKLWILFVLWINARWDVKKKEVNLYLVFALLLYGTINIICFRKDIAAHMISLGIGITFIGLSTLTDGGIGMGDSLLLLAMGTVLETSEYIIFIGLSFLFAAMWSVLLVTIRKKGKKTEIPMIPFLLSGYVGGLFLCG